MAAKSANGPRGMDSIKLMLKEQKREMAELKDSVFLKEFKADKALQSRYDML